MSPCMKCWMLIGHVMSPIHHLCLTPYGHNVQSCGNFPLFWQCLPSDSSLCHFLLLFWLLHSSKGNRERCRSGDKNSILSDLSPSQRDCTSKHCQRHNGPEGWVHITSYYTNLDQTVSEFWLSINFQISTNSTKL